VLLGELANKYGCGGEIDHDAPLNRFKYPLRWYLKRFKPKHAILRPVRGAEDRAARSATVRRLAAS
jgi:hypothetical protein